jgi:hypothetical protein
LTCAEQVNAQRILDTNTMPLAGPCSSADLRF